MHKVDVLPMYGKRCLTFRAKALTASRWSNTSNKLLQLANETLWRCKLQSVVARIYHPRQKLLHIKISFLQVEAACFATSSTGVYAFSTFFFNLQRKNFVAWQCLKWVVIRSTTLFNWQRNIKLNENVAGIIWGLYTNLNFPSLYFRGYLFKISHLFLDINMISTDN